MYTITIKQIERFYANCGMHAEQSLAFTLTDEIRTHDKVRFDMGSDIPEYHMSVKSSGASLMSGRLCTRDTKEGIIEEFVARSASSLFAYVVADFSVAYVMTGAEFAKFCMAFSGLCRESQKNGGLPKVKLHNESQKMRNWLASMVA